MPSHPEDFIELFGEQHLSPRNAEIPIAWLSYVISKENVHAAFVLSTPPWETEMYSAVIRVNAIAALKGMLDWLKSTNPDVFVPLITQHLLDMGILSLNPPLPAHSTDSEQPGPDSLGCCTQGGEAPRVAKENP